MTRFSSVETIPREGLTAEGGLETAAPPGSPVQHPPSAPPPANVMHVLDRFNRHLRALSCPCGEYTRQRWLANTSSKSHSRGSEYKHVNDLRSTEVDSLIIPRDIGKISLVKFMVSKSHGLFIIFGGISSLGEQD